MSYYSLSVFLPPECDEIPLPECLQILQTGSNRFCATLTDVEAFKAKLTELGAIIKYCECLDSAEIIETSSYDEFLTEVAQFDEELGLLRRAQILGEGSAEGCLPPSEDNETSEARGDFAGSQDESSSDSGSLRRPD